MSDQYSKSSKLPKIHATRQKKHKKNKIMGRLMIQWYQNIGRLASSSAVLESKMPTATLGCVFGCFGGGAVVPFTFATGGNGDSAMSASVSIAAGASAGGK